jgi:UDP-GlcNAc:undecaprenyl-phosphate GlcNAc-1-phosphate transferase
MNNYLAVSLATLLATLALTPCAIRLAHAKGWVDTPGVRKIHRAPVAYLGGAAIFGALVLGFVVLSLLNPDYSLGLLDVRMRAMLGGAILVFAVGLVDDIKNVRPRVKLAAQIAAALLVWSAGVSIDQITFIEGNPIYFGQASILITVLWIVGITNAVNLIDGMDGLASGLSAVACGAIGMVAFQSGNTPAALLMAALCGAILGFLPYNLNPAKIFLGDAGSMVLGFLLSTTAVLCTAKTSAIVGFGIPIVALGIPIFDTLFSMVRRVLEGRSLFAADKNHIHHRLLKLGYGQTRIVLLLCAETALAVALLQSSSRASLLVSAGMLVLALTLHVMLFRAAGAVRFRSSFTGFSKILVAARDAKSERSNLDDIDLALREATNVKEWWTGVTSAAHQLGFVRLNLPLDTPEGESNELAWVDIPRISDGGEKPITMTVPIRHRRSAHHLPLFVEASPREGIELASRRMASFCRLLDRHHLSNLPANTTPRTHAPKAS